MTGSKVFTAIVIAFWAVMMTALVRVEFYPRESRLVPISTTRLLDKIFKNPSPARLDIIYQGAKIGHFQMDVAPLTALDAKQTETPPDKIGAYDVSSELFLNLVVFGAPSQLHLRGSARFDPTYEMKTFTLHTGMAGSQADLAGDNTTKKLTVSYDVGDGKQYRQVDYGDLNNGNALAALGLPGLQQIPSFLVSSATPGTKMAAPRFTARAYYDFITIGDAQQRAYLLDVQIGQGLGMTAKIWIDEQGNILKADTSMGLSLMSQVVSGAEGRKLPDRTLERAPRKHDLH